MLTPYAWTVPGGVNNHIAALAERFTAQGHRVTIIAPSDDRLAVKAARERVREVLLGSATACSGPTSPTRGTSSPAARSRCATTAR